MNPKTLLQRARTPIKLVIYAIYLYLSGLSLRQTARALASIGFARSHEAVRKWVHRLAGIAAEAISLEKADTVIVDETVVNVGGRQVWLWVAIEPERRAILALYLSETRNALIAYSLFVELKRRGVKHVITDGAKWYSLAARWAKLGHEIVHGGVRSYVERFICTVKDRLRGFDVYFPSPHKLLDSALRLLYAWAGFYNYVRIHLSFGEPPRGIVGFTELERLTVLAQKGWQS